MLNKVQLIGYLGGNPDFRRTAQDVAVATLSLATTRRFKDRDGKVLEETEWHRAIFFGHMAEIVNKYCHKGMLIYIEGRLKTRKWEENGKDRYTTEIIAEQMRLLESSRNHEEKNQNED